MEWTLRTGPTALPIADGRAWAVIGIGFLALSVSFSARSALGLVMPSWAADFAWTRGFMSTGGAVALIVMALTAPLVGNLADRHGPRALLTAGLAVIAAGMAMTATMSADWQFILGFSLIGGAGFGIIAIHTVSTAVTQMAPRAPGLAVGIASSGATAGQLLIVPLIAVILGGIGWRPSFFALAVVCLLLAPVVWLVLRPGTPASAVSDPAARPDGLDRRLRGLAVSPLFHALFWSFTICGFTTAGVIEVHLLPYAAACGFPPLPSAVAYGVLSAFNMIGMVLAGYLADRTNRVVLLGAIYLLRALCFVPLLFIVGNYPLLILFAVLFGLFDYSTVPVTASLVASHIGLKVMGLTMGLLPLGHALGAAAGAFLGGVLFDLFARYAETWIASALLSALAGFIVLLLRDRPHAQLARAPT